VTSLLASVLAQAGPTTTVARTSKPGTSLLDPIAKPIAWVLEHIYAVVPNYGVAIVILSVLWMLIIAPLTLKSTRSMLAMQKLQPQLKKLQEQHRNDRQAFAEAQMALFREHNVSPFGACLPTLLPFPVFFALYRVITGLGHKSTVNGVPNTPTPKYISHGSQMYNDIVHANGHLNAFWMDLSKNAFSHHSSFGTAAPFWILLLIMAGTGYMQSAQMLSRNPAAAQNPQMKLMKYLPLLFVVIFARLPAGVLVYYAMSNVCRIIQQDLMYRFDPKVKALVTQEVQEVEALTHEIDERGPDAVKNGGAPAASMGGSGTKGKSRFQQLLETAREQQLGQQTRKDAKAGGAGGATGGSGGRSKPSTSKGGGSSGNGQAAKNQQTNGQAPKGNQPGAGTRTGAGARGAQSRTPQSGGHRTNRKRRRR
jgi:YidC/Oxa1 family membrane protein insertase